MPEKRFNSFHPEWRDWMGMLEWNLKYDEPLSVEDVISAMVDEGFTITPPPRKRYRVKYNGKLIFELSTPGNAAHLGKGYSITDSEEGSTP